jgi:DDE superfamily endonuclease
VLKSWGHNWVVVSLILSHPFWSKTTVWSLPLTFCLYRNWQGTRCQKKKSGKKPTPPVTPKELARRKRQEAKQRAADPRHRTRPDLAIQAISRLAEWFPQRQFLLTGDSAYGGKSVLSKLPPNVDLISRVHAKGVMYAPPPKAKPGAPSKNGRPRKKGERLPGMQAWANDPTLPWKTLKFHEYGLKGVLQVKVRKNVLYYKSGGSRKLTIVLTHDPSGKRFNRMFYCTRRDLTARQILSLYAARWSIEACFENTKQLLGLEDAANRKPKAVERTAPMALVLYSLSILWFHQTGHQQVRFPESPWYRHKRSPSFADILCTLRRESYLNWFSRGPCRSSRIKTQVAQLVDLLSLSG